MHFQQNAAVKAVDGSKVFRTQLILHFQYLLDNKQKHQAASCHTTSFGGVIFDTEVFDACISGNTDPRLGLLR